MGAASGRGGGEFEKNLLLVAFALRKRVKVSPKKSVQAVPPEGIEKRLTEGILHSFKSREVRMGSLYYEGKDRKRKLGVALVNVKGESNGFDNSLPEGRQWEGGNWGLLL